MAPACPGTAPRPGQFAARGMMVMVRARALRAYLPDDLGPAAPSMPGERHSAIAMQQTRKDCQSTGDPLVSAEAGSLTVTPGAAKGSTSL